MLFSWVKKLKQVKTNILIVSLLTVVVDALHIFKKAFRITLKTELISYRNRFNKGGYIPEINLLSGNILNVILKKITLNNGSCKCV